MIIIIMGWTREGKPLNMYKIDMSVTEHKHIDDVVSVYKRMHPSAVRVTMDIALPLCDMEVPNV